MFKNLTLYRIAPGWSPELSAMEDALQAAQFVPCTATQDKSVGWVPPRGEANGALIESVAGQRMLKLQIETKSVPSAAVRKLADETAAGIEQDTGRRPGRKEMKTLREDALLALLPNAIPRLAVVCVWIDHQRGWLATDASGQGKLDDVVTALVRAFDGLVLTLFNTNTTPQAAMTNWLSVTDAEEWPEGLAVERECELRSNDEERSVVRFTRHHLFNDDVRRHIAEGKLPTRLALCWEGRVGFVLTESMQLKKINFLEGVFKGRPADEEKNFDTDIAIGTAELRGVLDALIVGLGGELQFKKEDEHADAF